MTLVKKVNSEWVPSENRGLAVGDTMDVTDARALVDQGMAVYVDREGKELIDPTVQTYKFPVLIRSTEEAHKFIDYFLSKDKTSFAPPAVQSEQSVAPIAPATTVKAFKDMTDEEKKAFRVANLAKGREKKLMEDAVKKAAEAKVLNDKK